MKIFTYYTHCAGHNPEPEVKLLALWKETWAKLGVEPFVLQEWHARQSPGFGEFHNAIGQLPTTNNRDYEKACFLRWLALAQVGGGWMMDYDLFPNRFSDLPHWTGAQMNRLQLMQANCVCPCFVYASSEVALRLCGEMAPGKHGLRTINGQPHYSDQYVLCDLVDAKADWIDLTHHVLGYGDAGWEKAEFVHFSNSACVPRGKTPRWQHIPTILQTAPHGSGAT